MRQWSGSYHLGMTSRQLKRIPGVLREDFHALVLSQDAVNQLWGMTEKERRKINHHSLNFVSHLSSLCSQNELKIPVPLDKARRQSQNGAWRVSITHTGRKASKLLSSTVHPKISF